MRTLNIFWFNKNSIYFFKYLLHCGSTPQVMCLQSVTPYSTGKPQAVDPQTQVAMEGTPLKQDTTSFSIMKYLCVWIIFCFKRCDCSAKHVALSVVNKKIKMISSYFSWVCVKCYCPGETSRVDRGQRVGCDCTKINCSWRLNSDS